MEHQTEEFGTVPPDQVPEAYAAKPLFGPSSEMAGESASDPAEADGDLAADADGDLAADADGDLAADADGDPAADADGDLAADASGIPAADADGDPAAEADDNFTADGAHELPADADDDRAADPAERPATGEPRVDAALARLDDLAGLPVTEHRAVFEDVHRRLRDVLGELDTGQLPGAGDAAGAESRRGR